MEYTFRDCSLEDVLFVSPAKIPVSSPLPILPSYVAGGLVATENALTIDSGADISKSLMSPLNFGEMANQFINKNWLGITIALVVVGGICFYYKKEKERKQSMNRLP